MLTFVPDVKTFVSSPAVTAAHTLVVKISMHMSGFFWPHFCEGGGSVTHHYMQSVLLYRSQTEAAVTESCN